MATLIVRPLSAKLTRDTEAVGKMDPYVKIIVGAQSKKTAVHEDGGKTPHWKDELVINHSNEEVITIEVKDEEKVGPNVLIASGSIPFSTIIGKGGRMNEPIPLTFKGKSAGEVRIDFQYFSDELTKGLTADNHALKEELRKLNEHYVDANNRANEFQKKYNEEHELTKSLTTGNHALKDELRTLNEHYVDVNNRLNELEKKYNEEHVLFDALAEFIKEK